MCWQCANPDKTFGDYVAEVIAPHIRCHGFFVQSVQGGRHTAPLTYTIGLTEVGLPELALTGLAYYRAVPLLSGIATHVLHADDARWLSGEHVDTVDRCFEIVDVPHPDAHLHHALGVFGADAVTAQQLVWADSRGRWPWERGHRAGRGGQPVLGPRAAIQSGSCIRLDAVARGGEDEQRDGAPQ